MKSRQISREFRTSTPEEDARYHALLGELEKEKPAILAEARRTFEAFEEDTFSGELRRAIHASGIEKQAIAESIGVPFDVLNDFMGGRASLPFAALDKLVDLLGYRLTKVG